MGDDYTMTEDQRQAMMELEFQRLQQELAGTFSYITTAFFSYHDQCQGYAGTLPVS